MVELADTYALGAYEAKPRGGSSPLLGISKIISSISISVNQKQNMFKKMIRPFQQVLLEKKLCVGCTHRLEYAKKLGNLSDNRYMVECKCKRRYVYNKELGTYQRATFAEEQQILNQIKKGGQ